MFPPQKAVVNDILTEKGCQYGEKKGGGNIGATKCGVSPASVGMPGRLLFDI
jgi:hypothetical protein